MKNSPLNNSTIIEFYGLPGSGKSTIAKEVIDNIAGCGYNVLYLNKYLLNNKRDIKIIILSLLSLRKEILLLFFDYLKFIIKEENKIKNLKKYLAFIRNYSILTKVYNSKVYDYIVVDQGIIQELVSISYDKVIVSNKSIKKVINDFLECFPTITFVNVDIDDAECKERLKNRSSGTSTLDFVDANFINGLMNTHRANFEIMGNLLPRNNNLFIDSSKSSAYNAKKICNYLM